MGAPEQSLASGNLPALSDKELFQRYCKNCEDAAAINELWNRHYATVHRRLERLIVRGGLCPKTWNREQFRDHCLGSTFVNVRNRICKFEWRGSLDGWLTWVATTTALDEHEKYAGGPEVPIGEGEEPEEQRPSSGTDELLSSSRSEHLDPYWWLKPPPPPDARFRRASLTSRPPYFAFHR